MKTARPMLASGRTGSVVTRLLAVYVETYGDQSVTNGSKNHMTQAKIQNEYGASLRSHGHIAAKALGKSIGLPDIRSNNWRSSTTEAGQNRWLPWDRRVRTTVLSATSHDRLTYISEER
jgi:hypothetical protein